MAKLAFVNIEFSGIERIEPAYSPDITSYTIHRAAGSNFCFRVTMNEKPYVRTEDDAPYTEDYPGFKLQYHVQGSRG